MGLLLEAPSLPVLLGVGVGGCREGKGQAGCHSELGAREAFIMPSHQPGPFGSAFPMRPDPPEQSQGENRICLLLRLKRKGRRRKHILPLTREQPIGDESNRMLPAEAHAGPRFPKLYQPGGRRGTERGDELGGGGLICSGGSEAAPLSVCLTPDREEGDRDWTGVGLLLLAEALGSCSERLRSPSEIPLGVALTPNKSCGIAALIPRPTSHSPRMGAGQPQRATRTRLDQWQAPPRVCY